MIDESSAIYQIFLRNFTPEGTFAAAIPCLAGVAAMGFDWVCLTPIHPIGVESRKGKLGSPLCHFRLPRHRSGAGDDRRFWSFPGRPPMASDSR